MWYTGKILSRRGDVITVDIVTNNETDEVVEIGSEESGLWFAADEAVVVSSERSDELDVILSKSCSINLLVRNYEQEFFQKSITGAKVNVWRQERVYDGVGNATYETLGAMVCVFAGYVVPRSYNQPFNSVLDELELSCVDALGMLDYCHWRRLTGGTESDWWRKAKAKAVELSMGDIVRLCLDSVTTGIALRDLGFDGQVLEGVRYLWDGSRAIKDSNGVWTGDAVWDEVMLDEKLFFGDETDDVWSLWEVLEEVLRWLNLHIVQEGMRFYVYGRDGLREWDSLYKTWYELDSGSSVAPDTSRLLTISMDNVADDACEMEIGEIYNEIVATAEPKEVDDLINPLDSDKLTPVYAQKQLYMEELSSEGEGDHARQGFRQLMSGEVPDWDATSRTQWLLRVKQAQGWTFSGYGAGAKNSRKATRLENLYNRFCDAEGQTDQQRLALWLGGQPGGQAADSPWDTVIGNPDVACNLGAAILSFGSVRKEGKDTSLTSSVSMSDCVVLSVNGHGTTEDYPTEKALLEAMPVASYSSDASVYQPADDLTTHYVVISGSIQMVGFHEETGYYKDWYDTQCQTSRSAKLFGWMGNDGWYGLKKIGPCGPVWGDSTSTENRYYVRRYFGKSKADDGSGNEFWMQGAWRGVSPAVSPAEKPGDFVVCDSAIGKKFGVLRCILVVGDKCVVGGMNGKGGIDSYTWKTYRKREDCASTAEWAALNEFTIGFELKEDECILNDEHKIFNNISFDLNIEGEGTAIAIKHGSGVGGKVEFYILGAEDSYYDKTIPNPVHGKDDITISSKRVLAHTDCILLKDFNIKVVTDSGGVDMTGDHDIKYRSERVEGFVSVKSDITFKIASALTTQECVDMDLRNSVCLSTPIHVGTREPVLEIKDTVSGETGKAEQLYVDSAFKELSVPRVVLHQNVEDVDGSAEAWNRWKHPALGDRQFRVWSVERDLQAGEVELTLKEV